MSLLAFILPLTVFAYFLAAIFCGICVIRSVQPMRGAWIGMAVLLILLGLNRQWNLLPDWVGAIREAAWLEEWYSLRKIFQTIFIIAILLFLLAWFLAVLWNSPWQLWLPITATTLLVALSIIRAISLSAADLLLYQEFSPGVQFDWILELSGIGIVMIFSIVEMILSLFRKKTTTKYPQSTE